MLELYLDISITLITNFIEDRDYRLNDYAEWGFFMLNNYPVISIKKLELIYFRDENGVPEVIHNEKTGLLVAPGDINAFADSILKLLDSPTMKRELGENAREYVLKHNSMKNVAKKYLALYQAVSDNH